MAMHLKRAEITTSNRFPLDMLRYDSCFPYRGEDVEAIAKSQEGYPGRPYTVTVARYSSRKRESGWTPQRWESFGCRIVERD